MVTIAENLLSIRQQVRDIARSAGRSPEEIQIVAVSKTFGEDLIREAHASGQIQFGENYAQEFRRKEAALRDLGLTWHFIGHLQSNKARDVVGRTHLIHSVDRISLAKEIQRRAESAEVNVGILVEVHTTDEATKSGVPPENLPTFVREIAAFDRLSVRGLMTMGPFTDDPEDARSCFQELRTLRDQLRQDAPDGMTFDELSMGMTADYRVAIEEGATIIRIGTAIFGQRKPHGQ